MLYDVLIVGAGPVGNFLAGSLARKGFTVVVCEEHGEVGIPVHCTGVIGTEAFDAFGLDRASSLGELRSVKVYGPEGTWFRYEEREPFARVVDRTAFDRALAEAARRSGAAYVPGVTVNSVEVTGDRVVAVARKGDSREFIEARLAVMATGRKRSLLYSLGFQGPPGHIFAAQVRVPVQGLEETEVYVGREVTPGSFAWAVPVSDGWARVGITTYDDPVDRLAGLLRSPYLRERVPSWCVAGDVREFRAAIRGKGRSRIEEAEFAFSRLPLGALPSTTGDRVLVAGEAAGQVKTTTGGGVYYGLIGAALAAETIEAAFTAGRLGRDGLEPYEQRWRSRLEREIEWGRRLRRLGLRLGDASLALLVDLARRNGLLKMVRKLARFDWHADFIARFAGGGLAATGEGENGWSGGFPVGK